MNVIKVTVYLLIYMYLHCTYVCTLVRPKNEILFSPYG